MITLRPGMVRCGLLLALLLITPASGRRLSAQEERFRLSAPPPENGSGDLQPAGRFDTTFGAASLDLDVEIAPDVPLRISSDVLLTGLLATAQDHLVSGRYYPAAQAFRQAVQLDPGNESALAGFSACLLLAKDYAAAQKAFQRMAALYPSRAKYRLNLAAAYTGLEQYANALRELKALLQRQPRHGPALYNLGMNLALLDKADEARKAFEACRERQPQNPMPLLALARLAAAREDMPETLRLLRATVPLSTPRDLRLWLEDAAFDPWRDNEWFTSFLGALGDPAP